MLQQLFGNSSVEKILFFLLINGRCYAGKLARHFHTPLTPLQHGLSKLESLGILESYSEGKIRYYQFNQDCPYLHELDALLRKGYSLMPSQKKKEYYDPEIKQLSFRQTNWDKARSAKQTPEGLVIDVWSRLSKIEGLSFSALSLGQGNSGWNGIGKGQVEVKQNNDSTIQFNENGSWVSKEGKEFKFSNIFRWSLDRFKNMITLEHLRFGEHSPVFLFHLAQIDENTLESVSSHVCNDDTYLGQVRCNDRFLMFNWRIIGPKKNETIDYVYT